MDFNSIKQKIVNFKNKTIEKGASSVAKSKFIIATLKDLDFTIKQSKNKKFTDDKTGEEKTFNKYSIVIYTGKDKEFYKEFLFGIPLLVTKAWAQNIYLRICICDLKKLEKFNIKELPSLVLYSNENVSKIIVGKENIRKIIKKFNLNIVKTIEDFKEKEKEKKEMTKKNIENKEEKNEEETKK